MLGDFQPSSEPGEPLNLPQLSDAEADRDAIYNFFSDEQLDFHATLLNFRNNRQLEALIGQRYSTTVQWSAIDIDQPIEGYKRVMLEYFRIVDIDNTEEYISKYNLSRDIKDADIAVIFSMPLDEVENYKDSKVPWKRRIYEILSSGNRDLLLKQVVYMKYTFARRLVSAHRRPSRKPDIPQGKGKITKRSRKTE